MNLDALIRPTAIVEIEADLYHIEKIATEIITFTGTPPLEVWRRLCMEMQTTGYNVVQEARRFGVTSHQFNDQMATFYTESDGFIYETSVESTNWYRRMKWRGCVEFLLSHSPDPETRSKQRILLYGDSVGTDSIYLRRLGFDVYYHDFQSLCSRFAHWRFQERGIAIHDFTADANNDLSFDYIVCLEVAEHVPAPDELARELGKLLAPDGYCLFSESFGLFNEQFPTHLESNLRFAGQTDQLMAAAGLYVYWRDVDHKPIIFTKRRNLRAWVYGARKANIISHIGRRIDRLLTSQNSNDATA